MAVEVPKEPKVAVFCVGNRLHLDDGIGPAVYDVVMERYQIPENLTMLDVGVMTLDLVNYVDNYDVLIAVDAVENTGEPAGTVVRFKPEDVDRGPGYTMSLHDLKLADLFDAALLIGYEAEGVCLGMQVQNADPVYLTEDLTPPVKAALPLLVETLLAELARYGIVLRER
ncbi:MAG: hydrogenase maturation protease [Eggerthellaceae bacterium]|nr:hydrogenase maturation protease [Eggerthellaceae bacterium]